MDRFKINQVDIYSCFNTYLCRYFRKIKQYWTKMSSRPAFKTDNIGFEVFQHDTKLALKSGEKNWEWQRACISFGHFEIFQNDQRDCTKLGLKSGRQSTNGILKKKRWEWQTDCIGFEDGADFTEELCIIQILKSLYLFLLPPPPLALANNLFYISKQFAPKLGWILK